MKVIIAGSRDILDPYEVDEAILWAPFHITEVVCGMARGVDLTGFLWAKKNCIPVKEMPAAWRLPDGTTDKGAGLRRNEAMAVYADALIAVWDGTSPGTADMIKRATKHKLPIHIHRVSVLPDLRFFSSTSKMPHAPSKRS